MNRIQFIVLEKLTYSTFIDFNRLRAIGIECQVGTGSTPTCSLPLAENDFFSEFHPGNYIFYG